MILPNWAQHQQQLSLLHQAIQEKVRRGYDGGISTIDFTQPQIDVLSAEERFIWYRAGNQLPPLGKSIVMACEAIWYCLEEHPFKEIRKVAKTIDVMIFSANSKQSKSMQRKIWELVPKNELAASVKYDAIIGFQGVEPACRFRNGNIIRFKTLEAGTTSYAGFECDLICVDEPIPKPAEQIFSELEKRVQARNGRIILGFAPIGQDCQWLVPLITPSEERPIPLIKDYHYRANPSLFVIPRTGKLMKTASGIECNQEWVDSLIQNTIPAFVPIRIHGEMDAHYEGARFPQFDRSRHVFTGNPIDGLSLKLGIDHGSGNHHSSCAVLLGMEQTDEGPIVWVLDEYYSETETTQKQDAKGIIAMLDRNDVDYHMLHSAFGDKPHKSNALTIMKSNTYLHTHIATELNIQSGRLRPKIGNAKEGANHGHGSVDIRQRWLTELFIEDRIRISSKCNRFIESLHKFDGNDKSQWKHLIDAMLYGCDYETFYRFKPKKKRRLR